MSGKWKPGDQVRFKGALKPKMIVRGTDPDDADKVECDWLNDAGDPKNKTYHEDQLEEIPKDEEDEILPITRE